MDFPLICWFSITEKKNFHTSIKKKIEIEKSKIKGNKELDVNDKILSNSFFITFQVLNPLKNERWLLLFDMTFIISTKMIIRKFIF